MRKYIEVIRMNVKAQLAWRVDVIFQMLFTISKILFAYLLWGIIFQEENNIAGFTFHGMLSYYVISSFLSQLDQSSAVSMEIYDRIRGGTFSKYMIIPINIEQYFIAQEIGVILFYLTFDFLAAIVWIFVFQIQFVITTNILLIFCAILMILLGLLFMVQLNYWVGLLTLKFEEITTFLRIKDNLMSLITGTLIPLALFPNHVVSCMKILPFYYVTYLPSMLLLGRCQDEAANGLLIILFWCVCMQLVIQITWKKYRIKFDGVGI